ncbi:uncharacterized protein LOC124362148 isoform X2 [Homalodisca vitripennis]|nr:uncharacterized protein LOC124362148 isoform X2 [Homalodisca vitripennis]
MSNANNQLNIKHIYSNDILQEINSSVINELKSHLRGSQCLVACCFIDNFIRWLSLPFYKFDEDEYWSDAAEVKIYCPEDIPQVFDNLKRDWPHSIHTYFFLLNFMDWTENSADVEFDFYCPNGDPTIGSVLAQTKFKGSDTFINYHCVDYISCKAIHDGLKEFSDVNWSQPLIFESIHERLIPELYKIISEKGLKINKNDRCYQLWLPPAVAKHVMVELQSELYMMPLDANHTEMVNKHWEYSGPGTSLIIKETLTHNGGLGVLFRENDTFAGWAVEQHYGGIGMLYIHPEYRRQGYATELVKGMVSRLVDREIDPFALIEEHNQPSRLLFQRLKFESICMVHWIRVQTP